MEKVEELKSIKEVSSMLGVRYQTLYRALKRGEIPFYRIGRAIRLNPEEVIQAVKGRKETQGDGHEAG